MKKTAALTALILYLACSIVGAIYWDLRMWAKQRPDPTAEGIVLDIPHGLSVRDMSRLLHGKGIITSARKFQMLIRLEKKDKQIKAGEYLLSAAMSPNRILTILIQGKTRLRRLTIPEGLTEKEIGRVIEESGFFPAQAFYLAAEDRQLRTGLGIGEDSLEGYLFPDTYYFSRNVSPDQIIRVMVNRFREIFTPAWEKRAAAMGFTVHEIVTLASIIEKETGTATERPVISSVFHNRLKRGMRLETDPTVIYGIEDFNGNLTRKHLKTPTPYNTYQIKGLPPGPIANPGRASLEAALYPAETNYIYFVSRNDTTHEFSTNLKDHNRAVRKYQLRR